ncbi:organic solvent tolerance protein OstA [Jeotgalibacillus salarius]|uniref:Organic solvent tolerance protein OstA n=1 Tax=Jeotgalibacillus salarius TaxID=546023 RepID=A0A4Y8LN43_9BACL|nr:organic solvent tolerance protein OstA [Jeotgalibacillus salarius]TFE02871.1 organic solvent tolerance protein OstA [Jeotgalibacillus salarius]
MAVKELNAKEQHYADTREEAEKVVEDAKSDIYLTSWKISEKHNKYGTYFLIDLAFSYDTPREIMENAPSKSEEPVKDLHEGVEYNVESDGTVKLNDDQEDDE